MRKRRLQAPQYARRRAAKAGPTADMLIEAGGHPQYARRRAAKAGGRRRPRGRCMQGRAGRARRCRGAGRSILAGTRFEAIEEGKSPAETTGEYIARLVNADESGTYTAEDAREIDEDMRRLARGEYYTHEQMLKELGL